MSVPAAALLLAGACAVLCPSAGAQRAARDVIEAPAPAGAAGRSYETAPDLFSFASAAADSVDADLLYQGWLATVACQRVKDDAALFEAALADADVRRAAAAGTALARCHTFVLNDRAAFDGLRRRMRDKLMVDGQRFLPGLGEGPMTDAQFARTIRHGDWTAFDAAVAFHLKRMLGSRGIPEGSADAHSFGIAFLQAACELGRDCTGASLSYLLNCAEAGYCPGSLEAVLNQGLDAQTAWTVAKYRGEIVAAVKARDTGYFLAR